MSRIPVPERGQPLDVSYIYQIVKAINDISSQLVSRVGRYTTVDTNSGQQNIRTSDARIVAGYINVVNNSSTSADGEGSFSYSFDDYSYAPVITATPILLGEEGTESGKDVTVVLTKITTNRVEGIVKFNTIGIASVGVNLLVVGIPV